MEAWVEVLAVRRVEEFGVLERLERLNSGDNITTNEKQVQLAYRRGRRRCGERTRWWSGRRGRWRRWLEGSIQFRVCKKKKKK